MITYPENSKQKIEDIVSKFSLQQKGNYDNTFEEVLSQPNVVLSRFTVLRAEEEMSREEGVLFLTEELDISPENAKRLSSIMEEEIISSIAQTENITTEEEREARPEDPYDDPYRESIE